MLRVAGAGYATVPVLVRTPPGVTSFGYLSGGGYSWRPSSHHPTEARPPDDPSPGGKH